MGNLVLLVALAGQLECAYGGWRVAAVCLVAAAGASLTSGAFEDPCTVVRVSAGHSGHITRVRRWLLTPIPVHC